MGALIMDDIAAELAPLLQQAFDQFVQHFGSTPAWTAVAPGRVNLIGDHTDYNDGWCLPFAIDRFTIVCASPSEHSDVTRAISVSSDQAITFSNRDIDQPAADWGDYLRGVFHGYHQTGIDPKPLNLGVTGNLPRGSGLSSSAALEVATALAVEAANQLPSDPLRLIRICQQAEHDFAGVPCGLLDQFAVTMGQQGHLMLFDAGEVSAEHIAIDTTDYGFLLIDSKVSHSLANSAYAERRSQCAEASKLLGRSLRDADQAAVTDQLSDHSLLQRRARHVVSENQRVHAVVAAIKAANWSQAGELMYASHQSLRDDYEVSCEETDTLVTICQELGAKAGVLGARMTGGGFGGSVIALVSNHAEADLGNRIAEAYQQKSGLETTPQFVRPVRGAHLISQLVMQ